MHFILSPINNCVGKSIHSLMNIYATIDIGNFRCTVIKLLYVLMRTALHISHFVDINVWETLKHV
jgi:hypothetical protein